MALVAIDTCLTALTLALLPDGSRAVSVSEDIGIGHAEKIAPAFAALLRRAGAQPSDITRIGVTVGPGSFMGQRVGIAFAKGLAMGLGAQVETVPLTTLEAIAEGAGGPVAVAVDARRGQVYAQAFDRTGEPEGPAVLRDYAEARHWLAGYERVAGSGVAAADPARTQVGAPLPLPEALLGLTAVRSPSALRTLYLRAPDAKPARSAPL